MTVPPNYHFVICRDLRHAWSQTNDTVLLEKRRSIRVFARDLSCMVCGTERRDIYRVTGGTAECQSRTYRYPAGYRIPGGIAVAELRADILMGRIQKGE